MKALPFFIVYLIVICGIVACGVADEPILPLTTEPIELIEPEYPKATPYGVITYEYLGTIERF